MRGPERRQCRSPQDQPSRSQRAVGQRRSAAAIRPATRDPQWSRWRRPVPRRRPRATPRARRLPRHGGSSCRARPRHRVRACRGIRSALVPGSARAGVAPTRPRPPRASARCSRGRARRSHSCAAAMVATARRRAEGRGPGARARDDHRPTRRSARGSRRRARAGGRCRGRRTPTDPPSRRTRRDRRRRACVVPPSVDRCHCRTSRARHPRGRRAAPRSRGHSSAAPTRRAPPTGRRRRRRRWRRPGGIAPAPRAGRCPWHRHHRGAPAARRGRPARSGEGPRTPPARAHGRTGGAPGSASTEPVVHQAVPRVRRNTGERCHHGHRPEGQRCRDSWNISGDARFVTAGGSSASGSSPRSRS